MRFFTEQQINEAACWAAGIVHSHFPKMDYKDLIQQAWMEAIICDEKFVDNHSAAPSTWLHRTLWGKLMNYAVKCRKQNHQDFSYAENMPSSKLEKMNDETPDVMQLANQILSPVAIDALSAIAIEKIKWSEWRKLRHIDARSAYQVKKEIKRAMEWVIEEINSKPKANSRASMHRPPCFGKLWSSIANECKVCPVRIGCLAADNKTFELTKFQVDVLQGIGSLSITVKELSKKLKTKNRRVYYTLCRLRELGFVVSDGHARGVYKLNENTKRSESNIVS